MIAGLLLAGAVLATPPTAAIIGTPPQPSWAQLTPAQKSALAPLSRDWDSMESVRRKKWLGIAERFPSMKPDEQNRMQERMREWVRLTPEQRAKVRDSYKDFNQLPSEQKQTVKEKWKAYANLPAEERQRLREAGKSAQLLNPPASEAIVGERGEPAHHDAAPTPTAGAQ